MSPDGKKDNNLTVIKVKRNCNALQAVRDELYQRGMDGRCKLYLKLQEKANQTGQRIVLFELPEPYHYLAYVGTTEVCVVEVEPIKQGDTAKEITGEKEIIEALLSYLAGGNEGLNGMRQQCEECDFKDHYDCYKEGIRNVMIKKGLLEKKVGEALAFV